MLAASNSIEAYAAGPVVLWVDAVRAAATLDARQPGRPSRPRERSSPMTSVPMAALSEVTAGLDGGGCGDTTHVEEKECQQLAPRCGALRDGIVRVERQNAPCWRRGSDVEVPHRQIRAR